MRWVTVDDMYNSAKADSVKLLSNYSSDFWSEYSSNHTYYDRLFRRMFSAFRYFDQIPISNFQVLESEDIEEVRNNFIDAVYDHLLANDKKYSELYRVSLLTDEENPIVKNYDITETKESKATKSGEDIEGQRTDTGSSSRAAYQDGDTKVYGATYKEIEEGLGAHTDSTNVTYGEQVNNKESGIAGFNSNSFSDDRSVDETIGERQDISSETHSARINTKTEEENTHTDTDTISHGARSETTQNVKGSQTDTFEHSLTEEYTLTRSGNIGVETVSEMIKKHNEVWSAYEFYTYIFKEICADLLLI